MKINKSTVLFLILLIIVVSLCACNQNSVSLSVQLDGQEVSALQLFQGQNVQLEAVTDVKNVKWQSSDSAVVVVEQDGFMKAKGVGSAKITCSVGKTEKQLDVTVSTYIAVESISIRPNFEIKIGFTKALRPVILPENASDKQLTFEISPADGKIVVEQNSVSVLHGATPNAMYSVTATNQRSGISAQFAVKVSAETEVVAWTIGDSIFDFNDLNENDMVQTILKSAGCTKYFMDNIAGSTIVAASGVGIIEHISTGMYGMWSEADLIIVHRGSNDMYYAPMHPDIFNEQSIRQAIDDTCKYLRSVCPDARIVWATPIWRFDVSAEKMDFISNLLHEICSQYEIEVFDLHAWGALGELNSENYGSVLYDGIHPSALGKSYYIQAFEEYFRFGK